MSWWEFGRSSLEVKGLSARLSGFSVLMGGFIKWFDVSGQEHWILQLAIEIRYDLLILRMSRPTNKHFFSVSSLKRVTRNLGGRVVVNSFVPSYGQLN